MIKNIINKHTLSNYVSNFISIIVKIFLIPFYIKIIGIEAYGLVGIFFTIESIFVFFDLGLGTTLGREVASHSVQEDEASNVLHISRTIEIIYWGFAVILGGLIFAASDYIATHWIQAENLSTEVIRISLYLMGAIIVFKWPISLYVNGIFGLNEIYKLNLIKIIFLLAEGLGAVLILVYVSPSIIAFFSVQFFIAFFQVFIMVYFFWKKLKEKISFKEDKPRFKKEIIVNIYKFTLGISAYSILSLIIFQTDKILLSRLVTLEDLGMYSIALTIPFAMFYLVYPITSVMLPKFTQLFEQKAKGELENTFVLSTQIVSLFTTTFLSVFVFFNKEILMLWLNDIALVNEIGLLSIVITFGCYAHTFTNLPCVFFISTKDSSLLVKSYLLPSIIYPIISVLMILFYGGIGAGISWLIINIFLLSLIGIGLKNLISYQSFLNWITGTITFPLAISLGFAYLLTNINYFIESKLIIISIASTSCFLLTLFSMKDLRSITIQQIKERF